MLHVQEEFHWLSQHHAQSQRAVWHTWSLYVEVRLYHNTAFHLSVPKYLLTDTDWSDSCPHSIIATLSCDYSLKLIPWCTAVCSSGVHYTSSNVNNALQWSNQCFALNHCGLDDAYSSLQSTYYQVCVLTFTGGNLLVPLAGLGKAGLVWWPNKIVAFTTEVVDLVTGLVTLNLHPSIEESMCDLWTIKRCYNLCWWGKRGTLNLVYWLKIVKAYFCKLEDFQTISRS